MDWLTSADWSMTTVYVGCALAGGAVLVIQMLLTLLGIGGDADVDVDVHDGEVGGDVHHGDAAFGLLSIKSVFAFLTFFGLGGWAALSAGWGQLVSLVAATVAGAVVMVAVAALLRLQMRLQSSGNVRPEGAVGRTATVYLRIPGARSGQGKITVSLQGRTVELTAVTAGAAVPTGAAVRVLAMPAPGVFEVAPLDEPAGREGA